MARYEPAMIDNAGATWASMDSYHLVPSAKRYEFYERSVAAVVCLCRYAPPSPLCGTVRREAQGS